ncbi:hypothetical protein [[Clostridium] hylemonae]|uniref:Uncharacterized protein n=1 Tax=[Clostridium] hylemonae DSM 15053 TaxID=553973 RepID=C0BY82_9FIRM|nr:hypothetical protein [[Clostridium] hylemonae]EEG74810.1 hypothetical protein CLOHYLEM_04770 [[Clostridium] hylemonae DSM 15053]QEK18172.1 hypothetical protein LAJLEIBI_02188 [[Clostridium] hylemonae DSM 15053]
MLGKLIKYDLKALNRFLVIIHAFLILSALAGRFFLTSRIQFTEVSDTTSLMMMLCFTLYFLIVAGVVFGTEMIIAVKFYKNLFSNEGYLSRTLPVTPGQHLLAKTIAGTVWCIIDVVLIFLSLWIVIMTPSVTSAYNANKAEVLDQLGITGDITPAFLIGSLVLIVLIGAVSSVVMIYASIAMGQLFSNHRILGAVVSYFIITTVLSIFSLLVMTVTGFFSRYMPAASQNGTLDFNFAEYMIYLCKVTVGLSIVTSILLYIFTYYILRKKTNLQ